MREKERERELVPGARCCFSRLLGMPGLHERNLWLILKFLSYLRCPVQSGVPEALRLPKGLMQPQPAPSGAQCLLCSLHVFTTGQDQEVAPFSLARR